MGVSVQRRLRATTVLLAAASALPLALNPASSADAASWVPPGFGAFPGSALSGRQVEEAAAAAAANAASKPGRRGVLQLGLAGAAAGPAVPGGLTAGGLLMPPPALAASPQLTAAWAAQEGVDFLSEFQEDSYGAMRDDTKRTPQFIKAIRQRVAGREGELTVLDIGTGPFALFALVAARAGAKKVYAIEANPEAAARARSFVAKADDIAPGTIEVIEGFSTAVKLPEKVDLVVAEIMGSIASEENMLTTIRDAQERHLKDPKNPRSYIPVGVRTFAVPVSYALHPILAPPRYERLRGVPLRVNCRDKTLQLLSDPQVAETFAFSGAFPGPGRWQPAPLNFPVLPSRLEANEAAYLEALLGEGVKEEEAKGLARSTAASFSGMAFWPELQLDEKGEILVESRGPAGLYQKSHWQTVLALMTPTPVAVNAGDTIRIQEVVDFPNEVLTPAKYDLKGDILSKTA